ncbi:Uncharacterized protein BM_BM16951 [Brugia malayi]|uniref:Bm16951 n=1 Tax=Brugia malayi TaxID=6279 RepID=A0A0H5S3U5_BRUMA|nr:Uncharacterized protein BM_BM16951 [Brugia malayi]CRZ23268.1 Bm16951 [Brugia malayi]VIO95107.1 Uncharacterized protein BM_BM16951 [Brugia malayi]
MHYIEEGQIIDQWVIQIPFALILLEIIAICIVRCILAFLAITKYKRKRYYCHQAPILDSSYFADAPSYVEKNLEDPARKGNAARKAAISSLIPERVNEENRTAQSGKNI